MARPHVDVVVPFRGRPEALDELRRRLSGLELRAGDSFYLVDNTPGRAPGADASGGEPRVLRANERATPGYARNRGAERGEAEWLVFFDADVIPPHDLLDRYFEHPVPEDAGLLAGGILDQHVPPGGPAVMRYLYISRGMSQDHTFRHGPEWGFGQTANVACRRTAYEAVGGFREDIRAGEDADLNYRLKAAGWRVERREDAAATHLSRGTLRDLIVQRAGHGSAAAWLDRRYPASAPRRRRPGLTWWALRHAVSGLASAAARRDRDAALLAVLEPVEQLVLEFGRSMPNERPLPSRSLWSLAAGRPPIARRSA